MGIPSVELTSPRSPRKSSEAPEVVPGQPEFAARSYSYSGRWKLTSPTFLDDRSVISPESSNYPTLPRTGYNLHPYHSRHDRRDERHRRRSGLGIGLGLWMTVGLILLAFCIGGGVGGGIGGMYASKYKASASSASVTATTTTTAPGVTTTTVLDTAGCPFIANTNYTSTATSSVFHILCYTIISSTQTIDIQNTTTATFTACLDACAQYNQGVPTGKCEAVTWVIFSPTNPLSNSVCFLKSSQGTQTLGGAETGASAYLLVDGTS